MCELSDKHNLIKIMCSMWLDVGLRIFHIVYVGYEYGVVFQSNALVRWWAYKKHVFHVNYKVIKIDAISCSYPCSKWHKCKKWFSILWPWGGWASLHFSVYNIIHRKWIGADRKCCVCLCSFIHFCTSYELPTKLIFYYSKKWQWNCWYRMWQHIRKYICQIACWLR